MPDEISRLSAEVARDPSSRASIRLAEALRCARRLEAARAAGRRALERHPYDADAHDVYARIAAETGEDAIAQDEWEMAIRLDGRHVGAMLGLAFLAYRRGALDEAVRRTGEVRRIAPDDPRLASVEALLHRAIEPPALADQTPPAHGDGAATMPRGTGGGALTVASLFAPVLEDGAQAALLVDGDGLVVAGEMRDPSGGEAVEELAAELSGLGVEATRALDQLALGEWEALSVECDRLTLSIMPTVDDYLVVVATPETTPKGMARVLLSRARQRAERWLEAL